MSYSTAEKEEEEDFLTSQACDPHSQDKLSPRALV